MFIAEIGSNWKVSAEASYDWNYLKDLIDSLDSADYIKFQFWDVNKFVSKKHPGYDRIKAFEFPRNKYAEVLNYIGTDRFMSTCFDIDTADRLKTLGQNKWKVASGDITNLVLIEHLSKYKDPIWISTGNATNSEIETAVSLIERHCNEIVVMHCISKYPTVLTESGLSSLLHNTIYSHPLGFSSHNSWPDIKSACLLARCLGAEDFEVHVGPYDSIDTMDSSFCLDPLQFAALKLWVDNYDKIMAQSELDDHERKWARRGSDGLRPCDSVRL